MLVLKLVPEILTYIKFLKTIKKKYIIYVYKYKVYNMIKKSIKDGIKIYIFLEKILTVFNQKKNMMKV